MYVTGSTGKTEDRSKFLTTLDLFKKHNITTAFMKKKNGILHLYSKINSCLYASFRCFKIVSSKVKRVGQVLFQFNDLLLQLLKII